MLSHYVSSRQFGKRETDIWLVVFSIFGVSWIMQRNIVQLLSCCQGDFNFNKYLKLGMLSHYVSSGQFGKSETV